MRDLLAISTVLTILWFQCYKQISYASTSVVLSDRSVYRSFFRTVPSDNLLVSGLATILDTYEWRQVSMFTEEQPQYLQVLYYYMILATNHTEIFIQANSTVTNGFKNQHKF